MSTDKPTAYVIQMNHFDPTWRRCWDRRFEYAGQLFASYADVEQAVIDDWLESAAEGPTTFVLEQTVSLRKYLERRPEHLETLRKLAKEGRFELMASGEVIPDANMPLGESLVRNMLYGILWAEDTLGVKLTTGCRSDGFGSSAQIPQIFRQCEIDWLPFLHYVAPDHDYWRGLDGTAICTRPLPYETRVGTNIKLRPCDRCAGRGCDACRQRGFDQSGTIVMDKWLDDLSPGEFGVMLVGGEETLPCRDIDEQVAARGRSNPQVDYRFGTCKDAAERFAADINAASHPPPERISRETELALSSAGCWVTRIKLKQRNRRAEHHLLAAETLAAIASLRGTTYPREELAEAWRTLVFTHFHDALPATHVDPAYDELMDMYDTTDETVDQVASNATRSLSEPASAKGNDRQVGVFNTLSWARTAPVRIRLKDWTSPWATARDATGELPVYDVEPDGEGHATVTVLARDVPALSAGGLELKPAARRPDPEHLSGDTIENDRFRIAANEFGITSILDKANGRELIDYAPCYAGELILERDYGDPWATRSPDRGRERLSSFGRRTAVRRIPGGSEIVFEGKHPGNFHDFEVNHLAWRQRVRLRDGLPYVEFLTDVDWDTHNRRLRLAMPTTFKHNEGDYEIPYGTMRRRRYDNHTYHPNGVNGDWPVTHWAAPATDGPSAAVINRGECSYRIENGNILVSLLRSPTTPWCMYEPEFYRMPLFDGMRDAAQHQFALAFYPFDPAWPDSDVTRQAWSYNAPIIALPDHRPALTDALLALDARGTMISTVKRSEMGDALVVRLYEYAGRGEKVKLRFAKDVKKAARVNLLERKPLPLQHESNAIQFEIEPFRLMTVRLEL